MQMDFLMYILKDMHPEVVLSEYIFSSPGSM